MKSLGRGAPLFAQVLTLVVLSMVLVHIVLAALVFTLPPPPPEIYRLSDIARALRAPGETKVEGARPLIVKLAGSAPREVTPPMRGHWRDDVGEKLAETLHVRESDVVVSTDRRRLFLRGLGGGMRRTTAAPPPMAVGGPPPEGDIMFRAAPPPGEGGFVVRGEGPRTAFAGPDPGPAPGPDEAMGMAIVGGAVAGPDGPGRPGARVWNERVIFAPFKVAVRQPDGRWLVAQPKPTLRLASWQLHILLTIGLSAMLVAPIAWLFARRLSAPIAVFAEAADRLGRDPRAPPLEIAGSREVAAATEAFNRMQERLRRYVEDRTAMVGAIAHDLRTPLTRLRFRIEAAPDEVRGKLAAEIDQMDAMISATLAFVRDTTRAGPREKLELASLVETIFDEAAETGSEAAALPSERLVVEGDPVALRRLIGNLVENALKYGQRARGRVFAEDGCAIVEIEDDGPGVPPLEIERLFEPFYRGEPSRSRETGGAGLGLAVVRSIARAHGGDVTLHNRSGGGLTARVSLPL